MTRTVHLLLALTLLVALSPLDTFAQGRRDPAPAEGDMAVGGNLGITNAFDDDFDGVEALLSGTFEYYLRDRISLRGMLAFTEFEADRGGDLDVVFLNGNVAYNWDHGEWRPFVTGGIGIYNLDPDFGPVDDDIEIGVNFGGGFYYFFDTDWAVNVEGLFHGVSGDGPDSFFTGMGGVKYYF